MANNQQGQPGRAVISTDVAEIFFTGGTTGLRFQIACKKRSLATLWAGFTKAARQQGDTELAIYGGLSVFHG